MSVIQGLTTRGNGLSNVVATLSKQGNGNINPANGLSPTSGSLVVVNVAGTVTITSPSWVFDFLGTEEIYCDGFANAGNNGRFTLTSKTDTTIVFLNSDGVNETLASAKNVIKVLYTPLKVFLDVSQTSGVPNYASGVTDTEITAYALGGVYSYFSAINKTDVDAIISISGGSLVCPAGSSIAHEVKPFENDATMVASGAGTGTVHLNIS